MTDAALLLDEPVTLSPFPQGFPFAAAEAVAGLLPTSTEFNHVRYMALMLRVSELTVEECQEFHDLMELNEAERAFCPDLSFVNTGVARLKCYHAFYLLLESVFALSRIL